MTGAYLLALLLSLAGLAIIDYRWKVAYFVQPRRTITVLAMSVAAFVAWDIAGILANIFFIGSNEYLLGVRIGEFPLEEIFFLTLLTYCSLISYLLVKRRWSQ